MSSKLDANILTTREREILCLIADGATSKEIGYRLSISYKTVDAHRENIKKKLRINSVAQMVRYAVAFGLVEPTMA
jgi:two-component system, NarL family, nitrate/nitrite response regulator NarL